MKAMLIMNNVNVTRSELLLFGRFWDWVLGVEGDAATTRFSWAADATTDIWLDSELLAAGAELRGTERSVLDSLSNFFSPFLSGDCGMALKTKVYCSLH